MQKRDCLLLGLISFVAIFFMIANINFVMADKEKTVCEINREYENTAVSPVKCECPEGYEFAVVSQKLGSCPNEEISDCPASTLKCVVEDSANKGKIKIENDEKFRYEKNEQNFSVDVEDEINVSEENATDYKLVARLKDGNVTKIKVMPDAASDIAIQRLKALNFTIQLKEKIHKNIPKVVYNIEANKTGKFLGVFKIGMKVNAEIDPETGDVLDVSKPWWAFLVAEKNETLVGSSCGTVTPGQNDKCCQNKGFDYWNLTSQKCGFNSTDNSTA